MTNEKQKSIYGIFSNKKTDEKLAFYPCPKNANTSAKLFFLKHLGIENRFIFLGDKLPLYKQTEKNLNGKINLVNFLPTKQKFLKLDVDVKCCIIRNPLDRFISSYKNRILYHKDVKFKNYSIDMILDKLENGLFENKHFLPQNFFLGDDLNYYNFYANVNNIKVFENKVNEFFRKKIKFTKIQIGGNHLKINISTVQEKRIKKIYEIDYDLLLNQI